MPMQAGNADIRHSTVLDSFVVKSSSGNKISSHRSRNDDILTSSRMSFSTVQCFYYKQSLSLFLRTLRQLPRCIMPGWLMGCWSVYVRTMGGERSGGCDVWRRKPLRWVLIVTIDTNSVAFNKEGYVGNSLTNSVTQHIVSISIGGDK